MGGATLRAKQIAVVKAFAVTVGVVDTVMFTFTIAVVVRVCP